MAIRAWRFAVNRGDSLISDSRVEHILRKVLRMDIGKGRTKTRWTTRLKKYWTESGREDDAQGDVEKKDRQSYRRRENPREKKNL